MRCHFLVVALQQAMFDDQCMCCIDNYADYAPALNSKQPDLHALVYAVKFFSGH